MNLYEQILLKYSCSRKSVHSAQTMENVEKIAGFALPDDYKDYLLNFTGFENHILKEYVCLWNIEELVELLREFDL